MPLKTKEENRKSELTSIIDVVFLLLIFFLVTLSIAPKTSEEGESVRIIPRQITQPKSEQTSKGAKQKVNNIIQVLDRSNSTAIYVSINAENFQRAIPVVKMKKQNRQADANPAFVRRISQPKPFGPDALYDINRLASMIKQGDKVSIRAPEMLPFSKLIEIYDLVSTRKATAFWGLGPLDSLHNLESMKNEGEWSEVY